jgi:hypothetical protein
LQALATFGKKKVAFWKKVVLLPKSKEIWQREYGKNE